MAGEALQQRHDNYAYTPEGRWSSSGFCRHKWARIGAAAIGPRRLDLVHTWAGASNRCRRDSYKDAGFKGGKLPLVGALTWRSASPA